ncbi:hypothetical protein DH2020_031671 [Rehmannia glutinosa]|uniref:FBD domain-containing protein n=1 Tax=Rehmannia glutinosa TaxID=99300 RepID=A0ABR0VHF4_REHGL
MEIAKQHSRKNRQKQNMPSVDRLSSLPDGILCHILSFLPTKLSVATSILAKRWRFIWAHVPNLDFRTSFSNIINRIMFLHKVQNLTTFRLYYKDINISDYEFETDQWDEHPCNHYQLETWITTAIERNVRNLDLRLTLMLPRCLFTCKTLVDLGLYNCVVDIPLTSVVSLPNLAPVSLPCLKKLHLYFVEYEVDETLSHLLYGCPVLEELIIDGEQTLGCCNISSPTLKRLTFNISFGYEFYESGGRLKINTPAVRYLQVKDCSCEHVSLSPMTALVEADISIINITSLEEENYFYTRCLLKFFDSLCNVKYLKLSEPHAEFPDLGLVGSYVRFDNLTKLELAADWRFLIKFLESAANLEVLVMCEVWTENKSLVDKGLKNWMEPMEERCTCLLYSLRIVRIDRFGCTEQEFNMVRYILRNAKVLKRMEIYAKHELDFKAKFDALQRISLFHRGSRECELAFSLDSFWGLNRHIGFL